MSLVGVGRPSPPGVAAGPVSPLPDPGGPPISQWPYGGPGGSLALAAMLEISFACPLCSRIFLADRPLQAPMPSHLDALLGTPCPTSGVAVEAFIDHHLSEADALVI